MKRYSVIYADPPWRFNNYSAKGEGRNAVAHYQCMAFRDLCALPIGEAARDDCVLFLWATDPLLPQALELIAAWGFAYKTVGFYWAKLNKSTSPASFGPGDFFTGLGYWSRANVEQCLLATRGQPRRLAKDVKRLVVAPRREHSRKPEEVYERIERLTAGPYLELFARESRPGWDSLGHQPDLFDNGPASTRLFPSNLSRQRSLF